MFVKPVVNAFEIKTEAMMVGTEDVGYVVMPDEEN